MVDTYKVRKATDRKHKYETIINSNGQIKIVRFGASGYSDFTKHKDVDRRDRYDARHIKNEKWGVSGLKTAGFWAKWVLWNKPSIEESIKDIEKRFDIKINF